MSARLAALELKHIIAALGRVLLNLKGSPVEKDVERLTEVTKDTLERVLKCAREK
jgi:hypothetical protein